ncbi:MAG: hypothetical protein KBT39_11470 [Bacteroidales bacterium]|nr:hypothetical protein [Bacteroidales bacterium]
MYSANITGILIVLGTAVILPITIIFLVLRSKMASEKNRKEIILAALEKNADIDIEELVRKMNTPDKLLKEKLLKKLQWGLVTAFIGVGAITIAGCMGYAGGGSPEDIYFFGIPGAALLAVGIAFIISYIVGRKMLAKEMEAEERNLRQA